MNVGRLSLLYDRRSNGKRCLRLSWRVDLFRCHVFEVQWW
jgi:hypothetical protein